MNQISIEQVEGLSIGHAQNEEAGTGVTALYFPNGARVGSDVSGGGPASREIHLTDPLTADNKINAIILSGGSAYGLAAADGVMRYLESQGVGYPTGAALVPLVCQSCIYDLGYKCATVRPDAKMGEEAIKNAMEKTDGRTKNVGGGCGATVGKIMGMEHSTKAGIGMKSVEIDGLQVTAVVIVNALGDVYNPNTGEMIAGLKDENGNLTPSLPVLYQMMKPRDMFTGNTTIGAIITNAEFNKAEMSKIASMTRSAYSRCINPVGTMADGDTIYAASVGSIKADLNMVGSLSAMVMQDAILSIFE